MQWFCFLDGILIQEIMKEELNERGTHVVSWGDQLLYRCPFSPNSFVNLIALKKNPARYISEVKCQ